MINSLPTSNGKETYFDQNIAAYLYIQEIMKKVFFLTEWKYVALNSQTKIHHLKVNDLHTEITSLFLHC